MNNAVDLSQFAVNASSVVISPELGYAVFDADSHYYEAEDAFTRRLPSQWKLGMRRRIFAPRTSAESCLINSPNSLQRQIDKMLFAVVQSAE